MSRKTFCFEIDGKRQDGDRAANMIPPRKLRRQIMTSHQLEIQPRSRQVEKVFHSMLRTSIVFILVSALLYYFLTQEIQQETQMNMARILITGSSDGIGREAAKVLIEQGHKVTLHARNESRAKEAQSAVPKAEGVLIGDLSSIQDTKNLAAQADQAGPWDSVIHNAGLGPSNPDRKTVDGLQSTFQVNSLAPYILTALMEKPKRLLYLSSSLHSGGEDSLKDLGWKERSYSSSQAYGDSKLHDIMLANAVARHWPDVQSCSLDPGWIATKMGGSGAPGKTSTPAKAIADFAAGISSIVGDKTGVYFNPQGARTPHKGALDEKKQEEFLRLCGEFSGVSFPK